MKKHLEYKIAAALAVSAMALPGVIYAKPVMEVVYPGPDVVINTPEDFINVFCSVRVLNEFNEEVPALIMEVNRDNYGIILAGKPFYDDYCINNPDMANAINSILIESDAHRSYEDYFNQAMEVQTILEQEAAAQAEMEQAALQAEMEAAAQAEMEQAALQAEMEQAAVEAPVEEVPVETLPAEEAVTEEIPAEAETALEEAVQESAEPVVLAAVYPAAMEAPQTLEVIAEPVSVSESPLLTMLAKSEPAQTETLEEVTAPVEEITPEVVESVEPVVQEVVPIEELSSPAVEQAAPVADTEAPVVEKMETTSDSSQDTSAAQSFVDRYLKDGAGNIYTAATPSNYTRIIGSLKEWNNLPASVQNEINSILMSSVGVSYQSLLQQAQQIASGAINRVNTGVSTQTGLFAMLAGFSALASGLFYRKQRGR